MMKTVTIRDVAKQAGVGTVSRVINDNPLVSQAIRQRVQEVISELHFVPKPTELIVCGTTAPPAR